MVDEILIRWNVCIRSEDSDDDDTEQKVTGQAVAVLLRLAVGPALGNRRRVSVSSWMAPVGADNDDMTTVGMCLDEQNECEIVRGERTIIKIRSVRRRCCARSECRQRVHVPLVLFAEWHPINKSMHYLLVPGEETVRMNITELNSNYIEDVSKANAVKCGYVPEAPLPLMPKNSMGPFELAAERKRHIRAKRAKAASSEAEALPQPLEEPPVSAPLPSPPSSDNEESQSPSDGE